MNEIQNQVRMIAELVDGGDAIRATTAAQKLVAMLEAEQLKTRHPLAKWGRDTEGTITAAELRELLDYDQETGNFYWRKRTTARRMAGATAGTTSKEGYVTITLKYRPYKAHRLAWLYVHGVLPNGVIDHINGNPSDNRIANLRETSQMRNAQNRRGPNANSKSGSLGVRPEGHCWRAQITSGKKTVALGVFTTQAEAEDAYAKAKALLHDHREEEIDPCESV